MGQVYKILSATQGRTYGGKHGDLVVWNVTLENCQPENGAASFELHKKPGNVPEVGDTVEVDRFAPGEFNGTPHVRIFAASNFQGGGGSSSGGGGGGSTGQKTDDNYDRRPDHPLVIAQRLHTSCLSTGREVLKDLLDVGFVKAADANEYFRLLEHVAARLTKTYPAEVLERASTAAGIVVGVPATAPSTNGGEVPADTTDMQPAPVPASASDQSIPF